MGTYNLRRFSEPEGLKAIDKKNLLNLLKPYKPSLTKQGFSFPSKGDNSDLDYEKLIRVFMSPDDIEKELINALYHIHEMATPDDMDVLLAEAERKSIQLEGAEPTPADIAVQMWLKDKDLLERKHAEQYLVNPRSFEYFQTKASPIPQFKQPSTQVLTALEKALDDWFEAKKRGRDSKIFVYQKEDGVWILVRHAEPYKREGSIEKGKSSSVFYRPEKYDVLVYDPSIGELRVNARSQAEKNLYRKQFGLHLFGNEEFFPGSTKYSLDPLRDAGKASLACTDIEGMEWVKLKEVRFRWSGAPGIIEIQKADDVFAAIESRKYSMPAKAQIYRASFLVQFTDSKTPRTVTIRPSNIADYTRDDDSVIVEDWLIKRGFIITKKQQKREAAAASLESS